ncbi:MAG: DUF2069 domain-containing protein [Burkholderiaceae bacterium]
MSPTPATVNTALAASAPPATAARARIVAIACVLALIALGLAWELWLAPTGRGTLALKVLPLVPALPGLLRQRMYTFRWLSLLVWLYVTEGLVRATSERGIGAALASIEVVLSVLLFAACAVYVRSRLAAPRPA